VLAIVTTMAGVLQRKQMSDCYVAAEAPSLGGLPNLTLLQSSTLQECSRQHDQYSTTLTRTRTSWERPGNHGAWLCRGSTTPAEGAFRCDHDSGRNSPLSADSAALCRAVQLEAPHLPHHPIYYFTEWTD